MSEDEKKLNLEKLSSRITYPEILNNVDLEYIIKGNNVKENIVVKEPCESYSYEFELRLKHLSLRHNDDRSIDIYDPDGGSVFLTVPAPFMCDARGKVSYDVEYETERTKENGTYVLKVTADSGWINAEDTVFPVTIDPNIEIQTSSGVRSAYYNNKKMCIRDR